MSICVVTEESIPPVQRFSLTLRIAETLGLESDVHLVSLNTDPNYMPENVCFHPIKVKGWNLFSLRHRILANIRLVKKIHQICQEYEIDLIYGWWPAVFIGATFSRKPFATDMPEFIEEMYRSFNQPFSGIMAMPLKFFQTVVARKSQATITESENAVNKWEKRGVSRERLFWAPYGIEVEVFQRASPEGIRAQYSIPEGCILVVYHGDIGFDDGVDLLIHAIKDLDVWFLCIGSGPQRYLSYLKSIAHERVVFTGWVLYSQIPRLLAAADIYVAPFRSTPYTNTTFPLKQMEAMAAGKATICTKLDAFSRSVTDGEDIKLVEPGNVAELRSAIQELAENKEMRKKLGHNARKTAIEKFDWRIRARTEIHMLKSVMSKIC